jgi:tetratricopeptide (TPR) repeat protein
VYSSAEAKYFMDDALVNSLLKDLKHPDESIRGRATDELWKLWFWQKGVYGLELLGLSQGLLETGRVDEAEALLTKIVTEQPDFAEAWNRRAVLHYLQGAYHRSISDCEMVLSLNPVHFGALHGLGLCYFALGEYSIAIQSFRRALEIQPYAIENQRLLLECTARLN